MGLTVEGDRHPGTDFVEQWPQEQLAVLLQAVLNRPDVESFGWTQYTPYFSDGEPCVFSANQMRVKLVGDDEDTALHDCDNCLSCHQGIGRARYEYDDQRRWVSVGYEGPNEERYNVLHAASGALESGHFDAVLLDKFGDHAQVTVTRDGISFEFYDHD